MRRVWCFSLRPCFRDSVGIWFRAWGRVNSCFVFTLMLAILCVICFTIGVVHSLCKGGKARGASRRIFSLNPVSSARRDIRISRGRAKFGVKGRACNARAMPTTSPTTRGNSAKGGSKATGSQLRQLGTGTRTRVRGITPCLSSNFASRRVCGTVVSGKHLSGHPDLG